MWPDVQVTSIWGVVLDGGCPVVEYFGCRYRLAFAFIAIGTRIPRSLQLFASRRPPQHHIVCVVATLTTDDAHTGSSHQ